METHQGVNEDIIQLVETYYSVREETKINAENAENFEDYGIRIFRLLEGEWNKKNYNKKKEFQGKPTKIETSKDWLIVKEKTVGLYTSVSILDEKDEPFPVKDLEIDNFKVFEKYKGNKLEADLIKLEGLSSLTVPIRIVIAIDTSQSMDGRKLEFAKNASLNLIEKLENQLQNNPVDVKLSILPFTGNNLKRKSFFNIGNRIWHNDFQKLKKFITGIDLGTSTPLWEALSLSIDELNKKECYPLIICLSDGANNSNVVSYSSIKKKVKKNKIPIYTIGYNDYNSAYSDEEDFPKLIEISKLSGAGDEKTGSFIQIKPEMLPNIFGEIATSIINTYGLLWKPTNIPQGEEVNVEIEIEYQTKLVDKITHKTIKHHKYRKQ